MATRYRPFEVQWQRGLNLDEDPTKLASGDLIDALNVYYSGSRIGTRPGIQYESSGFDGQIAGSPTVQGGYEFRRDNDATRTMVAIAGGNVYTSDTATATKGSVTIASGAANVWTFCQHGASIYAAGGAATDKPWYWSGSGNLNVLTINNLSAAALTPHYICEKWNRLFACGFTVTGTGAIATDLSSNPMIVRYSQINQPTVWPVANTFGGTSAVGAFSSYGTEYLTGFGQFTDNSGDWLLVLSNRTIYEIQESPDVYTPFAVSRRGKSPLGCVHQRAFVDLGLDSGDAIYVSEHGIHSLRQSQNYGGREDKFLSWKIRPLFESINPAMRSRICGAYWRQRGIVVFAVATGTNTVNDTLLVLDVKGQEKDLGADTARWTVWKLARSSVQGVNALWPARNPENEWTLYGGDGAGNVFWFDPDSFDDLGSAYPIRVQTRYDDHQIPGATKVLGDSYVQLQPGGTYQPRVRVLFDYGTRSGGSYSLQMAPSAGGIWDAAEWDAAQWNLTDALVGRRKLYTYGHYNSLSWRLEHSAADQPVYLCRLVHDAAGMGEDIGDQRGSG